MGLVGLYSIGLHIRLPIRNYCLFRSCKKFAEKDAQVLFASTDSEYTWLAWTNVARKDGGIGKVDFPVLADTNHSLSRDYGVLIEEEGVALRGIFLIDPKGVLRKSPSMTCQSVDLLKNPEIVGGFQFTEKYGEVCPANWHPGDETIKPSPEASKEYFNKVNK